MIYLSNLEFESEYVVRKLGQSLCQLMGDKNMKILIFASAQLQKLLYLITLIIDENKVIDSKFFKFIVLECHKFEQKIYTLRQEDEIVLFNM